MKRQSTVWVFCISGGVLVFFFFSLISEVCAEAEAREAEIIETILAGIESNERAFSTLRCTYLLEEQYTSEFLEIFPHQKEKGTLIKKRIEWALEEDKVRLDKETTFPEHASESVVHDGEKIVSLFPVPGQEYKQAWIRDSGGKVRGALAVSVMPADFGIDFYNRPFSKFLKDNPPKVLGTEVIESEECQILGTAEGDNNFRFWFILDDKGIRLKKIEKTIYDEKYQAGSRFVFWIEDFEQVPGGAWFPKKASLSRYTKEKDNPEKLLRRDTLTVEKLEIMPDLPDDLFHITFPIGTFVVDDFAKLLYKVEGEADIEIDTEIEQETPSEPIEEEKEEIIKSEGLVETKEPEQQPPMTEGEKPAKETSETTVESRRPFGRIITAVLLATALVVIVVIVVFRVLSRRQRRIS